MTPRERILAAFTPEGTPEIGVVTAYDGIFIRDHWAALTVVPWWYAFSGFADQEIAWAGDYATRTGLEWLTIHPCPPRQQRRLEHREGSVWRIDDVSGHRTRLSPPTPSGTNTACAHPKHSDLDSLPTSRGQIDELLGESPPFDPRGFRAQGQQDSAVALRGALDLFLYGHISSPLWQLYDLFGYEGMMIMLARSPELAAYTGGRLLDGVIEQIRMLATLGVDAVWIEECLTDQISPVLFHRLNAPLMRACTDEIRSQGLKSIYYYCGDPNDRLDAILSVGADALHFEESKKGFTIDIAQIIERVQGACTIFGNLDAIGILQDGSDAMLQAEVARQIRAGEANGRRFVMSTGSPIPPGTPVERVRRYAELVRASRT